MNSPFPPRLRAMSILPRWSLIWTINKDVVSSHSFFVTFYAYQIAKLIKWPGPRDLLLLAALIHDTDELVTGDLVSPVKRRIVDTRTMSQFVSEKMQELVPTIVDMFEEIGAESTEAEELSRIIKAADSLDAMFFAQMEAAMGNSVISARLPSVRKALSQRWFDLPSSTLTLERTWSTVSQAIHEHGDASNYDIDKPVVVGASSNPTNIGTRK